MLVRRKDHPSRARTSNVTDIVLVHSIPSGADLTEIFTWPKALKSFTLMPAKDDRSTEELPKPRYLTDILRPQMVSLENLLVTREYGNPTLSYLPTRSLRSFSALKFLGLPTYFLPSFATEFVPLGRESVLPANLECLQVEEPVFVSHRETLWNGTVDEEALLARAQALRVFLEELALLKYPRLPHLKMLRLWLVKERMDLQEDLARNLLFAAVDSPEFASIQELFSEIGILISCSYSTQPPK